MAKYLQYDFTNAGVLKDVKELDKLPPGARKSTTNVWFITYDDAWSKIKPIDATFSFGTNVNSVKEWMEREQ